MPAHRLAAALLAAAAAVLIGGQLIRALPIATPQGPPPPGPDLRAVFRRADGDTNKARGHAAAFAEINAALADLVEWDSKADPPTIRTATQLDEIRRAVREMRMQGFSFLADYPSLAAPLEQHFAAAVGTSGGALDDARRAAWIAAFRQLAACAQYAADAGHLAAWPPSHKAEAAALIAHATQEAIP